MVHSLPSPNFNPLSASKLGIAKAFFAISALFLAGAMPAVATDAVALVAERAAEEYGAELPPKGEFSVTLARGQAESGAFLREFWLDQRTGQFIANLVTDLGDVERISGAAILTVAVPVPTRRMLPDEIISDHDIALVEMPWERLGVFALSDPAQVVGMQVRRMLVAGRPVPRQSIIPPNVIIRGEKVTIELNRGGLRLMATGRATTDGHLGQEVRVVNLSSNKIINAIARGNGVVEAMQ
jgi:flagella basal body P-ring formation protein FlgA